MTIDPASTIIQSHWGLPSGFGHLTPIFFSFLTRSSAVESACLVDLHVAIIKQSAIEDFFDKSITFRFSAFASSKIEIMESKDESEHRSLIELSEDETNQNSDQRSRLSLA